MFLDLASNHYKYERVENYISARQKYQEQKLYKEQRIQKKKARYQEKMEKDKNPEEIEYREKNAAIQDEL